MSAAEQIKERDSFGNAIFPQSLNGIAYTGTIDMQRCYRANFVIVIGVAAGTVAAGLQYGNNAYGNDATNIGSGFNITNIAATNNQQATVELAYGASEMAGRRYLRGYITVTTIASLVCGVIYGTDLRYNPASTNATQTSGGAGTGKSAPPDNETVVQRIAG